MGEEESDNAPPSLSLSAVSSPSDASPDSSASSSNALVLKKKQTTELFNPSYTVWTVDFETPVCKFYLLFISADAAQEKEKREESAAVSTGVSKSAAHTVPSETH